MRKEHIELILKFCEFCLHSSSHVIFAIFDFCRGFYVGTSSLEEILGIGQCCAFRGSLSKLDVHSGSILWQTFMLPDNHNKLGGYSGAAIWGSSPSIDITRNHVYIATGNLYSTPLNVSQCQEKENNQTVPTHPDECLELDIHSESILALDLDFGKIKWYHQLGGYDVWFLACSNLSTPNCPPGPNLDADFGEAPLMLRIKRNKTKLDIVAAIQKSGFAWALDRNNGSPIWSTVSWLDLRQNALETFAFAKMLSLSHLNCLCHIFYMISNTYE